MRLTIFIPLICILSGCSTDSLHQVCPLKCYTGQSGTESVGECKEGTPTCNEDNTQVMSCDNEVIPSLEKCDNRDNDCDGVVDNVIANNFITSCNQHGVCFGTTVHCINGIETCNYPSLYEESETLCDNKDNDCDGVADNILKGQYCYTGIIGSEYNPPCHPGVFKCGLDQNPICVNETLPSIEMCDAIDNDCNGAVDDTGESAVYDIVLSIDTSGSMCFGQSLLPTALHSLSMWLDQIRSIASDFRFAILDIAPLYSGSGPFKRMVVVSNLSDIDTTKSKLSNMVCTGAGDESNYDAINLTCGFNNSLGLNWRENSVHMYIGFTDELGQAYQYTGYTSTGTVTESSIATTCTGEYKTVVFQWSKNIEDFDTICDETNGQCFYFNDSSNDILDSLMQIKYPSCVVE